MQDEHKLQKIYIKHAKIKFYFFVTQIVAILQLQEEHKEIF